MVRGCLFALLIGAITACATMAPKTDASIAALQRSPATCPQSNTIDHRTGPTLSNQPVRCVDNDELLDTGHSGDVGAALRQTVPIIR